MQTTSGLRDILSYHRQFLSLKPIIELSSDEKYLFQTPEKTSERITRQHYSSWIQSTNLGTTLSPTL